MYKHRCFLDGHHCNRQIIRSLLISAQQGQEARVKRHLTYRLPNRLKITSEYIPDAMASPPAAGAVQASSSAPSAPARPAPLQVAAQVGLLDPPRRRSLLTPPPTPFVDSSRMTAPALDVFVLTFNCGKDAVDANVFARHLHGALLQRGKAAGPSSSTGEVDNEREYDGTEVRDTASGDDDLPDLVVL